MAATNSIWTSPILSPAFLNCWLLTCKQSLSHLLLFFCFQLYPSSLLFAVFSPAPLISAVTHFLVSLPPYCILEIKDLLLLACKLLVLTNDSSTSFSFFVRLTPHSMFKVPCVGLISIRLLKMIKIVPVLGNKLVKFSLQVTLQFCLASFPILHLL